MPERYVVKLGGFERKAAGYNLTGRVIFGVIVIALGVIFTLDNFGILEAGDVLEWWPALLIAYGVTRLTGIFSRPNVLAGFLFTAIGALLLFHNLGLIGAGLSDLWPAILIVFGGSMVMGSFNRARRGAAGETVSDLSAFAFMSGSHRTITSQAFRGGEVTAIMGGHEIDLRQAQIADGVAVMDLMVWWGGVDLRVPDTWEVDSEAIVVMGAIETRAKPPSGPMQGRLVLRGVVLMGGVEVKS